MPCLHFWCFSSCKTGVKSIYFFLTVPRTTPARVSGGGGSHSELVITWEVTKQALAHTLKCTKVAVNGGRSIGLYLKQTHHAVSLVGLQFNFKKRQTLFSEADKMFMDFSNYVSKCEKRKNMFKDRERDFP